MIGFGFRAILRTYAHATLNRVLITELTIKRLEGANNDIVLQIESLKGEENVIDFDWEAAEQLGEEIM